MVTEYESLVDERRRLVEFVNAANERIEQARADIRVGQEVVAAAERRLRDIDDRLAGIRGT